MLRLHLLALIKRLWLARRKRLAAEGGLLVLVVVSVVGNAGNVAARLADLLIIGLALAELFLRRRDQAEVMLGMLIVIFRGHRISRALRVAGQLHILFSDVGRRTSNLYVRAVRLVNARQWVLMMATLAVATPHAFVLTVSHGCCSANPLSCDGSAAAVSQVTNRADASTRTHLFAFPVARRAGADRSSALAAVQPR